MASFYKRFVRDFMRYKDPIQCSGAELVAAVRQDAKETIPTSNGEYYALHIRRGDFQYKEVKLSAQEIVNNLHYEDGKPIIPPGNASNATNESLNLLVGSLVYVSTDDPDGLCKKCYARRKPCESYKKEERPEGCPMDVSVSLLFMICNSSDVLDCFHSGWMESQIS